jgi:acetyl-CoA carboxylase biotin carboxyl carrier protein
MTDFELDLAEIERLIKLVESRKLNELIVEEGGVKVVVRGAGYLARESRQETRASGQDPLGLRDGAADDPDTLGSPDELAEEEPDDRIAVTSPMVGVFYRSSGPDTAPYCEIGDRVEIGQIIGLIEAMKVFSEVPSEAAGTVVAIAASNGQLVRSGDPLLFLLAD